MRGMKIPPQDFALKMQGPGAYVRGEGGGGVFAEHYGIRLSKICLMMGKTHLFKKSFGLQNPVLLPILVKCI